MKVLLAFDKFKGCLSAAEACSIASNTIRDIAPDAQIEEAPLTDGGEGFVELLTQSAGGEIRRLRVTGPRGQPADASFGLVSISTLPSQVRNVLELPDDGVLAVVEMAEASGLQLLSRDERDPWATSTGGTGEVLLQAAATRPAAIVVGLGGSATHDLGLGALHVLGLQGQWTSSPSGEHTHDLVPANWNHLQGFSGAITSDLPPLWIASDVDNPLLGTRGAATVFAPQKGLRPADLDRLEQETARVAHLLCHHFQVDKTILAEAGSGAAGGIGVGLRIACGAKLVSGFSLVRAWLDLDRKLTEADLILTGEGTFDDSSLEGKGPGVLVRNAEKAHKQCLVLAGRISLSEQSQQEYPHCRFLEISPRDMPPEQAMANGKRLLRKAIRNGLKNLRWK